MRPSVKIITINLQSKKKPPAKLKELTIAQRNKVPMNQRDG